MDSNLQVYAHRADSPFAAAARETIKGLHHGVRELWTDGRDLSAFPQLRVRNPLVTRKTSGPEGSP